MPRGRWITPDSIPAETICRVLYIPDDTEIRASVNGALSELIYPSNWEQVGAVTPVDMAAAMDTMFWDYAVSVCEVATVVDFAIYRHQENQNVGGGTVTAGADMTVPWTHEELGQAWVTFDNPNNLWALAAGRYLIDATHSIGMVTGFSFPMVRIASPLTTLNGAQGANVGTRVFTWQFGFVLTTPTNVSLMIRSTVTLATNGFGVPKNIAASAEVYGLCRITRLGD